jgi:DNA-binding HxlR family transcriptional regulator
MKLKKDACKFNLMVSRDALEVLQGKWRLPIIISLTDGDKRFGEIHRDLPDISPKMLSQELKALETNKIIKRTLFDSMPVAVIYSLTPLGRSTRKLLQEMISWGMHFRKEMVKR